MATINLEITEYDMELIKKALRCYHYDIKYRLRLSSPKPLEYPHPINNYYKKEEEAAESLLLTLGKNES